jgi:hypothetical protein
MNLDSNLLTTHARMFIYQALNQASLRLVIRWWLLFSFIFKLYILCSDVHVRQSCEVFDTLIRSPC